MSKLNIPNLKQIFEQADAEDQPMFSMLLSRPQESLTLEAEGEMAGVGWVSLPHEGIAQIWMYLLPRHRQKKMAWKLWSQIQEKARSQGARFMGAFQPAELWLSEKMMILGFQEAGAYHLLEWVDLPEIELPSEFQIQSYAEVHDPALLLKMLNTCYSGQPGHQKTTPKAVQQLLDSVAAEQIFLLKHQDQFVGITRLEQFEGTCVVDAPGLLAGHRTPDLALALISQVTRGRQVFQMHFWGEAPVLLEAYLQAGATVIERTPFLLKPLN